jgi:hypothetical protein
MGTVDGRRSEFDSDANSGGHENRLGSKESPVWISWNETANRDELKRLAFSLLAVAIITLIQRPDIRQMLIMRVSKFSKDFCQAQADMWQKLATSSAQAYQNARL